VSSISKRAGGLIGHAKDPVTAGKALDRLLAPAECHRLGERHQRRRRDDDDAPGDRVGYGFAY
jgi:hypothetical protein